jgi:uncharacterized LabA/DUF88 family protein
VAVKRTAVLLDLGFVLYKLRGSLGGKPVTADNVHHFARECIGDGEELFRIYCYHCKPYGGTKRHPLTGQEINFSTTSTYEGMAKLIRELELKDGVAFRAGELSLDGWRIKRSAVSNIARTKRTLEEEDLMPDLKQKGVDMKIGLDVAWLASKSIVERIVLATSDSDFIPAMKFARREGVQIVLVTMGHHLLKRELKVHADELRAVDYP